MEIGEDLISNSKILNMLHILKFALYSLLYIEARENVYYIKDIY